MDTIFVWLGLCILAGSALSVPSGGMYCYECNSYMGACKDSVDNSEGAVYKTKCYSKCFVHYGEEGNHKLYRGCFDYYQEVNSLVYNYVGCRNQSWNGQEIMWCLCDTDLCNGDSMYTISKSITGKPYGYQNDVGYDNDQSYAGPMNANSYAKELPAANTYDAPAQGYIDLDDVTDSKYFSDDYSSHNEPTGKASETYKEVEQVHYGQADDIYVKKEDGESISEDSTYADSTSTYKDAADDAYKAYNDYAEKIVQEPYYPYDNEQVEPHVSQSEPASYTYDSNPKEPDYKDYVPSGFQGRVYCTRTGYFQNPEDCNAFIACIMDPHLGKPVMYPMRCPESLDWDNDLHICRHQSPTCGRSEPPEYIPYEDSYAGYDATRRDNYV